MIITITAPHWIIEALARDAWEDLTEEQITILDNLCTILKIDWATVNQLNDNTIRLESCLPYID